eukprot:6211819-Pleurochrysis_carterae.AAC.9
MKTHAKKSAESAIECMSASRATSSNAGGSSNSGTSTEKLMSLSRQLTGGSGSCSCMRQHANSWTSTQQTAKARGRRMTRPLCATIFIKRAVEVESGTCVPAARALTTARMYLK